MEKKYIKNGVIVTNSVVLGNQLVINPTESMLLAEGYVEYTDEYRNAQFIRYRTNEEIKVARQRQYEEHSDSLFIAYQKYLAQGKDNEAEAMRQQWLDEIERIEKELPYKNE